MGMVAAAGLTACAPQLDPPWLLTQPRELALEVEVVEQGPYGERLMPRPRTPRDALPLDTIRLRPWVVDGAGPVDLDSLDAAWWMCASIGGCLTGLPVASRPACSTDQFEPSEPCRLAEGAETTVRLADIPAQQLEPSSALDLLNGITVGFMASPEGGPGLDTCIARLDARQPLGECLLMERLLGVGPLSDLVALIEALGGDVGLELGETLLARPRNYNPAVMELSVSYGSTSVRVPAGTRLSVPRNVEVLVGIVPDDQDLDSYEVIVAEQLVLFSDDLTTQWWFDARVDRTDTLPGQLTARWSADGAVDEVRAYVVLRDNRGGEALGWLDFELEG